MSWIWGNRLFVGDAPHPSHTQTKSQRLACHVGPLRPYSWLGRMQGDASKRRETGRPQNVPRAELQRCGSGRIVVASKKLLRWHVAADYLLCEAGRGAQSHKRDAGK